MHQQIPQFDCAVMEIARGSDEGRVTVVEKDVDVRSPLAMTDDKNRPTHRSRMECPMMVSLESFQGYVKPVSVTQALSTLPRSSAAAQRDYRTGP